MAYKRGGLDMDVDTRSRPTPRRAGHVMRRTVAPLFVAAVGIIGLMWILGSLLVNGSVPSFVNRTDMQTTAWAVEHRTPTLDSLTHVGSMLADTVIAFAVTAMAVVILRL